jgi:hypothetical protein
MTPRLILAIVAIAGVSVCGLTAALLNYEMMDAVNAKLPKTKQFDALGWYWSKNQRLRREYSRLYPEGELLIKLRRRLALMILLLIICVCSLGFFGF